MIPRPKSSILADAPPIGDTFVPSTARTNRPWLWRRGRMEGKLGTGFALVMLVVFTLWAFPASGGTVLAEAPCSGASIVAADNRLPLCGTTTITSNTSRVLRLSVAENASLLATRGPGEAIEITGDGVFSGFALVQDLPQGPGATLIIEGLLPTEASFDGPPGRYLAGPGAGYNIPKGNYLLYLLADNSAVTVTLRISELSGSVRYRPTVAADAHIQRLPLTVGTEPVGFVYSGGAVQPFPSKSGLVIEAQWWSGLAPTNFHVGNCLYEYDGDNDPPEETNELFLPGCPPVTDGEQSIFTVTFTDVGTYRAQSFLFGPYIPPPGVNVHSIGLGGFVTSATPIDGYGSMAVWLDYGGQQTGVTPTMTVVPSVTATEIVPSVTATGILPSVTVTGILPSVTATGVVPSVTATGVVPSVTATGAVPSVTATVAVPSVTATGTMAATVTPGTAVATRTTTATPRVTGTATRTPEATGTVRPTETATVAEHHLYLPVILRQSQD